MLGVSGPGGEAGLFESILYTGRQIALKDGIPCGSEHGVGGLSVYTCESWRALSFAYSHSLIKACEMNDRCLLRFIVMGFGVEIV